MNREPVLKIVTTYLTLFALYAAFLAIAWWVLHH
jgi:hypothetical protein